MEYVMLGGTGLEISRLCLGTWMFGFQADDGSEVVGRQDAHALLDAAWERGINFFDTANNYGGGNSERFLGQWLQGKDRENFVVASKVHFTTRGRQAAGLSRKIIHAEIEATLERLQTDYLDIYYIHGWHEASPLRETLSAMNDLVRAGKVHYLGVSNFAAWQLYWSLWISDRHGWEPISVIQPGYNAADHFPFTVDPYEMPLPDLFAACRAKNIAVCPYAPLAGGFLTGKYERNADGQVVVPGRSRADASGRYGPFPERWWTVLEAVRQVAAETGASPTQVALRWTMEVEGLTTVPIFGSRSLAQLEENLGALDLTLSPDQHGRISKAGAYGGSQGAYIYS